MEKKVNDHYIKNNVFGNRMLVSVGFLEGLLAAVNYPINRNNMEAVHLFYSQTAHYFYKRMKNENRETDR
jgi:hypothetical protein